MNTNQAAEGKLTGYVIMQDKNGNLKFDHRSQLNEVPDNLKEFVNEKLSEGKVRILEEE